jgi:hypothetical protein
MKIPVLVLVVLFACLTSSVAAGEDVQGGCQPGSEHCCLCTTHNIWHLHGPRIGRQKVVLL